MNGIFGPYLKALAVPTGRLSREAYWVLAIPLAVITLLLRWQMLQSAPPSQAIGAVIMALLWMKYCLMSRRLHDCGYSGISVLPILLIMLTGFAQETFTPESDGDLDSISSASVTLEVLSELAEAAFGMLWTYCIVGKQSDGQNAFGPPFGTRENVGPAQPEPGPAADMAAIERLIEQRRSSAAEPTAAASPTNASARRVPQPPVRRSFGKR